MKPVSKSFKSQPTPLVSLLIVITSLLCAVFIYQHVFSSGLLDFSPIMMWLAIAIPAGVFGTVFLQVRAMKRTEQVHTGIGHLESQGRFAEDGRRTSTPSLNRPLPEKDPFESI